MRQTVRKGKNLYEAVGVAEGEEKREVVSVSEGGNQVLLALKRSRKDTVGYLLLVAAVLMASSMPVAFKMGSSIPFLTLLGYVSTGGLITSSIVMVLRKGWATKLKGVFHHKDTALSVMATGAISFAIVPLTLAYATHHVDADLAAVVYRTWPLLLVLLAAPMIHEKIAKWDILGVLMGFLGLASTLLVGSPLSLPMRDLPFVGALLGVALLDAFGTALSKKYVCGLRSSVFVYNLICWAIFGPLALLSDSWRLGSAGPDVIFSIIFLGVFMQAISAYAFYGAFRLVKTSIASTSFIACSFITMLLSFWLLDEGFRLYYFVVAATAAIGLLIQTFAPKTR